VALAKEVKSTLVEQYRIHETDCGSSEVQIALFTRRIDDLTEHFRTHAKDHHSRRGLLKLVSQRRRLLDYLNSEDPKRYQRMIKDLKLRK
jgi:small subunit ribosomal protein S15